MVISQLALNLTPEAFPGKPVETPNYIHGIVKNPVQRGTYYRYWWKDSPDGVTHSRYIRGSRDGTVQAESRKSQVEHLITAGYSPQQIKQFLESLPRSERRSRHPNFGALSP